MRRIACLTVLLAAAVVSAAAAELFFSRDFPGSVPAYFDITIQADGSAGYRETPDEEPLEFTVDQATVQELWAKVEALPALSGEAARKRKVAFTGDKIIRFTDDAGNRTEAQFVYTDEPKAQELVAWFLRASETARHRIDLERVVRFDRLGVNDALLRLQSSFDRERVVAPEQLLPVLEQIVEQKNILHLARSRAAGMIEKIQSASSPVSNE